jgi:hypothetical protein
MGRRTLDWRNASQEAPGHGGQFPGAPIVSLFTKLRAVGSVHSNTTVFSLFFLQQEGLSPVFVCTYGAGGVGLTLTAASTIILLDRPWTPGDTRQAEDRVRRIGQTKAVKAIWMSAFDMDIQVDEMLESKTQTSNAVLADGHSPTGYGAKISIPKLLQCLMAKVS